MSDPLKLHEKAMRVMLAWVDEWGFKLTCFEDLERRLQAAFAEDEEAMNSLSRKLDLILEKVKELSHV
ncbi:MAG: hypothetical protein V3V96_14375 [Acidiferrobacterales bacterium]